MERSSDIYSVSQYRGPERLSQPGLRHDIHRSVEKPFEPRFEASEIHQRAAGVERHKQVHIADGRLIPARHRPEQSRPARATGLGGLKYLATEEVQLLTDGHAMNLIPLSAGCGQRRRGLGVAHAYSAL